MIRSPPPGSLTPAGQLPRRCLSPRPPAASARNRWKPTAPRRAHRAGSGDPASHRPGPDPALRRRLQPTQLRVARNIEKIKWQAVSLRSAPPRTQHSANYLGAWLGAWLLVGSGLGAKLELGAPGGSWVAARAGPEAKRCGRNGYLMGGHCCRAAGRLGCWDAGMLGGWEERGAPNYLGAWLMTWELG